MKTFALGAALALLVGAAAPASALEIISVTARPPGPALALTWRDLSAAPPLPLRAPAARMSELPEPGVVLMLLLGLCLVGYRASRVSDEKFQ